jgi:citrate lyase subunit beta / citryl-CoA lyase
MPMSSALSVPSLHTALKQQRDWAFSMASLRTVLYVPANQEQLVDVAIAAHSDAVILDLEDGVPAEDKPKARRLLARAATRFQDAGVFAAVRVNAANTSWFNEDVGILRDASFDAVVLPKADHESVGVLLEATGGSYRREIWALVESVRAVLAVEEIASISNVSALVLGYGDLAKDLSLPIRTDYAEFQGARELIANAARRHSLRAFDGVHLGKSKSRLELACMQTVTAGFEGKTLLDSAHVATCREVFQLEWIG